MNSTEIKHYRIKREHDPLGTLSREIAFQVISPDGSVIADSINENTALKLFYHLNKVRNNPGDRYYMSRREDCDGIGYLLQFRGEDGSWEFFHKAYNQVACKRMEALMSLLDTPQPEALIHFYD
jgi:hypothetical protein